MLPEWMQRLEETRDQWDARRGKVYQDADDIDVMTKAVLMTARKVVSVGNSLAVTLPSDWLEAHDIKVGDTLILKAELAKRAK